LNNVKIIAKLTEKEKISFNKLATHPLQSWQWGEFREREGHQTIRLGLFDDEGLREIFQLTIHKIPHTPFSVGYLPKSVLPCKEVIEELKRVAKKNKTVFIKLEPNILKNEGEEEKIKKLGLIPGKSIFTKYTSIIDLTLPEDELFKNLKPKTRYNIKVAQKHGVYAEEDNSEEAFNKYLELLFETANRQNFYAHNKDYHRKLWRTLKDTGIPHLLTAKYQGKILAAFMLFIFNKKIYYPYGASTREYRELMAPTLLMWEAIRFGKKHGCLEFDLWGDTAPNPSPNHPYYGFHRFKAGFSPKLVEFLGAYDLVINSILYRVYNLVDKIRWKFLRLKAKF